MADLRNLLTQYNACQLKGGASAVKELELKLLTKGTIDSRKAIFKQILEDFIQKYETRVQQTARFITEIEGASYVKELYFENGVQNKGKKSLFIKKRQGKPVYLSRTGETGNKVDMKLCFATEEDTKEELPYFNFIRFRYRLSFVLSENWRADITFVKTMNTKDLTIIKDAKEKLFSKKPTDDLENYADGSEIELEYIGSNPVSEKEINEAFNYIKVDTSNVPLILCRILGKVYNESRHNTLKKILPGVIEINKKQYFSEILPQIENFYITDKADGTRVVLFLGPEVYYYDNSNHTLASGRDAPPAIRQDAPPAIRQDAAKMTVVECEKVGELFYAYDIFQYEDINLTKLPFEERIKSLRKVAHPAVRVKEFVKLSAANYADAIKTMYDARHDKPYRVDGIIFTSAGKSYAETSFYKWKPVEDMTIDFMAKKCPASLLGISPYNVRDNTTLYILFCGIKQHYHKKLNIKRLPFYGSLFPFTEKYYFPIQFSPSDEPLAFKWYHERDDLDGKIVELRRVAGAGAAIANSGANAARIAERWDLCRLRDDRAEDAKLNYCGNSFKVAEIIWRNYKNPLNIEHLCASYGDLTSDFYFINERSHRHKGIRTFNNFVKQELIAKYGDTKWAVDLGCGKGQDILKYLHNKVQNVLMIDSNENNLCEVVARKYSFCDNTNIKNLSLGIYLQRMDLNDYYLDNVELLKNSGIPIDTNEVKLVVCNFAIHYMARNRDAVKNIVKFVDALLPRGGRFIFTCLDGKKVFDKLCAAGERSGWGNGERGEWGDGEKYKIVKKEPWGAFKTGLMVNILLPFSDGRFYEEYLVNLDDIDKCLKERKILKEASGSFSLYLEEHAARHLAAQNAASHLAAHIDDIDREYIDMLAFRVYYKK